MWLLLDTNREGKDADFKFSNAPLDLTLSDLEISKLRSLTQDCDGLYLLPELC